MHLKNHTFIYIFSFILLFSCSNSDEILELKQENDALRTEIANLKQKIEGLDKQNTEYLNQLEILSKQLNNDK